MDSAEEDVLAYMHFPAAQRTKLQGTNPIERLNGEIRRRTDVVGIVPNEAAVLRLVGAILLEQSDEWATQRARDMTLEAISTVSDTATVRLSAVPARPGSPTRRRSSRSHTTRWDTTRSWLSHCRTGSDSPHQLNPARQSSKRLAFPKTTALEAPPIRPERHVQNSIATLRMLVARELGRAMPRCPCCQRLTQRRIL
jgi:hypothetical protein